MPADHYAENSKLGLWRGTLWWPAASQRLNGGWSWFAV